MGPQRGSATAELAICLPAVAILIGVVLAVGAVVAAQVRCVDAARTGARLAARGESPGRAVDAARAAGPAGVTVQLGRAGGEVVVTVRARLTLPIPGRPSLPVSARAVAAMEQGAVADRGSATPLMLATAVLALMLATAGSSLGQAIRARHAAAAAADLAALAAAGARAGGLEPGTGCGRGAAIAAANGARLTDCSGAADGSVTVAVAVPLPGALATLGPAVGRARAGPAPAAGADVSGQGWSGSRTG